MELSLHILDIAENAILSGASLIEIELEETRSSLGVKIVDDGRGMSDRELRLALTEGYSTKPFGLGLGLPKFLDAARASGGTFSIESTPGKGTTVTAKFPKKTSPPLGDIAGTVTSLLSGIGGADVVFTHDMKDGARVCRVGLDTRAVRRVLGDVPIFTPEAVIAVSGYIVEQYKQNNIFGGENL